jgi:hypothetical protein
LIIHGFSPNLQATRKALNNSFISCGKYFLIQELYLMISLLKEIRLHADAT